MAITIVNKVTLTPGGDSGGTTGAIDCTGANCFVCIGSTNALNPQADCSDSLNAGVWDRIVDVIDGKPDTRVCIWVKFDPIVGSSQTFTMAPNFGVPYCSGTFYALAGVDTAFGVDQISAGGSETTASTIQPGSITPGVGGSIILCGESISGGTGTPTINSGFTRDGSVAYNAGVYYGHAAATLIQGGAAAVNPTWSNGGTMIASAAVQLSLRPDGPSMAVAITEGGDTVAASLNSTFAVSVAITETSDSISASLNSTFNTAIAITESPDIVLVGLIAEALLDIAITESPDAILASMGGASIVINIGSEDADTVSIILDNDGSWAACTPVDTNWAECSDPDTTWTTCTNPSTDWTVN